MAMQGVRGKRATIERGAYVRVTGVQYGSYDGEVGRVYGDLAPVKGEPAYGVDMGDILIAALEKDLTVVERSSTGRVKRMGDRHEKEMTK